MQRIHIDFGANEKFFDLKDKNTLCQWHIKEMFLIQSSKTVQKKKNTFSIKIHDNAVFMSC